MIDRKESKEYRKQIRQSILDKRRNISDIDSLEAGHSITEVLRNHEYFKTKRWVASYLSVKGEVSTTPINDYILDNHELLLPRIHLSKKGEMDFYKFNRDDELIENRFHILEPKKSDETLVSPQNIDAMVVPLVAFDNQGNRLGMGGGFYDRILKKVSYNCLIIGVAYDFQLLDEIPTDVWDMPLNEVITPTHHYIFGN